MPNQPPARLRLQKNNRLTRRQGEALIKALLTIDEDKMFGPQEKKSFRAGFDKLTKAWREALEKENGRCTPKQSTSAEKPTGSTLYPPPSSKAKRAAPKIIYLRKTGVDRKNIGAALSSKEKAKGEEHE